MSGGKNYDGKVIHRVRRGDPADRTSYTPLDGELIQTTDGLNTKVYVGDQDAAGGFLVGPLGIFGAAENAGTDLVFATPVPWGNQRQVTEEFTHSTSTNPSEITIDEAGIYSVKVVLTVLFSATCNVEMHVQRHNGSIWQSRPGAKAFNSGVSGKYRQVVAQLDDAFLAGYKVRAIASNSNLIASQVACVSTYSTINILRVR